MDEDLEQDVLKHENGISDKSVNITITEPLVIEKWDSMIELQVQPSKKQDGTELDESHNSAINLKILGSFNLHENN